MVLPLSSYLYNPRHPFTRIPGSTICRSYPHRFLSQPPSPPLFYLLVFPRDPELEKWEKGGSELLGMIERYTNSIAITFFSSTNAKRIHLSNIFFFHKFYISSFLQVLFTYRYLIVLSIFVHRNVSLIVFQVPLLFRLTSWPISNFWKVFWTRS